MNETDQKLNLRFEGLITKLGLKLKVVDKSEWFIPQASGTNELGGSVYIQKARNSNTHLSVSGHYPKDDNNYDNSYGIDVVSINITLSKTDEQIIKDIERRFTKEWLTNLDLVIAKNNNTNNARNNRKKVMNLVAQEIGAKVYDGLSRDSYPQVREYFGSGHKVRSIDVKTDHAGEELKIELSVDVPTAMKLLKLIREVKQ